MNGYDLSRNFWNWAFDNPEKISPNHAAVYFFAVEHCNRLGGKEKFGFPSQMTMDAIGIKKHSTYIKYFNDLVDYKFFKLIQKSTNQYSANIISLVRAIPKKDKALDKAIMNHRDKQTESNGQSKRSIDKQLNNQTTKKEKVFSDEIKNFTHSILEYFPIKPKKIETWHKEIDLLTRVDKYDFNTILEIIKVFRADSFWSGNFQSLLKLRKVNKEDIKYIDFFNQQLNTKNNGHTERLQRTNEKPQNAADRKVFITDWDEAERLHNAKKNNS